MFKILKILSTAFFVFIFVYLYKSSEASSNESVSNRRSEAFTSEISKKDSLTNIDVSESARNPISTRGESNSANILRGEVKEVKNKVSQADVFKNIAKLSERQSRLFNLITQRREVRMNQIESRFKAVSQRTLRRDLSKLEEMGLILKTGSTKDTVYLAK